MKKFLPLLPLLCLVLTAESQTIVTGDAQQDSALATAFWTIDHNTEGMLLKAGADYGGEWTRDIAMNSWNAVSLLRPDVAEYSLWSVTDNRRTIGHQYWDKILWVIAAWNHYLVTGNEQFLAEAYACGKLTMSTLEDTCFDKKYGLFMGPAVFQDGCTAYEEPVYEPTLENFSFVLDHPRSHHIKCLSTNAVYYEAYKCLAAMAEAQNSKGEVSSKSPSESMTYLAKASDLKKQIRKYFLNKKESKLYYLIDEEGHKHEFQEGLGVAYAILFDIVTAKEAEAIVAHMHQTPSGIPAIWPHFKRFSDERPGRHNVMIWPHVCMYYAAACAHRQQWTAFEEEMRKTCHLATRCDPDGEVNFHEIYTQDGIPSGGWQCSGWWPPLNHQTWCATGFLRNYLNTIIGLNFERDGIRFSPHGATTGLVTAKNIRYRNAVLDVTVKGHGTHIKSCRINGTDSAPFLPATAEGHYEIILEID